MMASMTRFAAMVGMLSLSWQANAVEGMEWSWNEGQSRRYVVRTQVASPETVVLWAEKNIEPPVDAFTLAMVVDCTLEAPVGKKAFDVACDIDQAMLSVTPVALSRGKTMPVLDEWTTLLENEASVRFVQTTEGKVRSVNLYGVDGRNNRTRKRGEILRQIVERAFAAFDLQLPKKGTDGGTGGWVQRDGLPMKMMSSRGSLGGMNMAYTVISEVQGNTLVGIEGVGTVTSGETVEGVSATAYKLELAGSLLYDPAGKQLINAQFVCSGSATAGGGRAEGIAGPSYEQSTYIELVPDGAKTPDFGPNVEL